MGSRDLCGCLPSGIETEVCANGLSSLAEAIRKEECQRVAGLWRGTYHA